MPIPLPTDPVPSPDWSEVFYSPDGTRAVWVRGDARDAFLYDLLDPPSFDPRWLDWNVDDVQFHMDGDWLSEIELIRFDGESVWFDPDGNPRTDGLPPEPEPQPEPEPEPQPGPDPSPEEQPARTPTFGDAHKLIDGLDRGRLEKMLK
ncbi:MAG: hypothetical protein HY059_09575 [Proteobacteria bacterium]|nr:hypothetical protein [Pseudomonadota bacterium]